MPRKAPLAQPLMETPKTPPSSPAITSSKKKRHFFSMRLFYVILLLGSIGAAGFFYWKYWNIVKNPQAVAQEEIEKITSLLGKIIVLPDETPTIATVSDKNKLPEQPFFKNAQVGDRVLLYSKSQKAILYRESENKIIEVMPIAPTENSSADAAAPQEESIAEQQEKQSPAPPPENQESDTPIRVALYNGSTLQGQTYAMEQILKESFSDIEVVAKESAARSDYEKTVVINLKNIAEDTMKAIVKAVKGEIGELDPKESVPDADVLVIIGK